MRTIPSAYLKTGEENRLLRGHPWVYDNEIGRVAGKPLPGDEIHIFASNKRFLGTGFFSPSSKIRIRRYSWNDVSFSSDMLKERLAAAVALRTASFDFHTDSTRIVFAEADGLPGLIVDRYVGIDEHGSAGSWLSMQILSVGIERYRQELVDSLVQLLAPQGIHERSEGPARKHEGLEASVGILHGHVPGQITIKENGLDFRMSLLTGQKTGWFLDQRENRATVATFAAKARVLDVFSNEGGFSLAAAKSGAESVLAIDSSEEAINALLTNASMNKLDKKVSARACNAFDYLRDTEAESFDLVILDPPAFAKSKATLDGALRGYKEINLRGMKILAPGGILATFSCSYWLSRERLLDTLESAAADANVRLRYLKELGQAQDHPVVSGYGESRYLKGFIVQVSPRE